jgi:hypothetical protein
VAVTLVMRIVGLVNGEPTVADDKFVKAYHPERLHDATELVQSLEVTDDPAEAIHFADATEARNLWATEVGPPRPWDGKPNRPLTAFTISLEPYVP